MSDDVKDRVIAILVEKLGGSIKLTNEEIEDAPDIMLRSLFDTDEVEFRTVHKNSI